MRVAWFVLWVLPFAPTACRYDWTLPSHIESGPEGGIEAGEAGPRACAPSNSCPQGSVCTYPDHACGAQARGTCITLPTDCKGQATLYTCACDHGVYTTLCDTSAAGTDPSVTVACPLATSQFQCGYALCTKSQYCVKTGTPPSYSCVDYTGCATNDCACATIQCATDCQAIDGGFMVTCPG
jgi:hypothetical protein